MWVNFADTLMLMGEYDQGIENIEKLIKLTKKSGLEIYKSAVSKKAQIESQKHNYLGGTLMKENRLDEAKEEFLTAIELFPKDKRNYSNIGVIFIKNKDIDSAIIWFKKAIEIDINYVRGYYNLGTILLKKSLFKQAIDIFNKALEIEPDGKDSDDIRTNLGVAQENYEIPKNELIDILSGKIKKIANDYIIELANSIFSENIISVDFIISQSGKNKVIAYCKSNKYEISLKDNDLVFRKIE